jgi:hypothetical protein
MRPIGVRKEQQALAEPDGALDERPDSSDELAHDDEDAGRPRPR